MIQPELSPIGVRAEQSPVPGPAANPGPISDPGVDLQRHRAETERLRVLIDFLARPIHAHGGNELDPDVVTAYNLAVEAALHGIRRAAQAG